MAITQNKKAYHEYEILEKFEAGLVLTGAEIKAIRAGKVNLSGTFCRVYADEAVVLNMHIGGLEEPEKTRRLLLHKSQIRTLAGKLNQKGFSLIPLALYLKRGYAKLEIGLAKGKNIYDRREQIKKKDIIRQKDQELNK